MIYSIRTLVADADAKLEVETLLKIVLGLLAILLVLEGSKRCSDSP